MDVFLSLLFNYRGGENSLGAAEKPNVIFTNDSKARLIAEFSLPTQGT